MAKVESKERCFDFGLIGRLGRPFEYGQKIYGWLGYGVAEFSIDKNEYGVREYGGSQYGTDDIRYGIYQRRHSEGKVIFIREEFYWPKNPQTGPQQSWRNTFAAGMTAWKNLTDEQKAVYHEKATKLGIPAQNLFMKQYLNSQ